MKSHGYVRKLTTTAILSAIAFALMFVEISVPIMPSFVKLDISDLPALLGAFAYGPVYGIVVELIKNLLHILFKGTSSAFIGELFNFTCGAVFAASAGLIYRFRHTRRGAVLASLLGCLLMALVSLPLNYFVVYPLYARMFGGMENIIGAYEAILGVIAKVPTGNSLFNCLLVFNVPFTFVKGLLDAVICFFIYKPLSGVLKGSAEKKSA